MRNWQKQTDAAGSSTWIMDDGRYQVVEKLSGSYPAYWCFRKNQIGKQQLNFVGIRNTPELARELCEILDGAE